MSVELWRKALLRPNGTLGDAIHNLNDTSLQIVLVISDDGTLVGTVTDGDVRRGLLRGLNMGSSIGEIISRDPLVVPPQMSSESVRQLMEFNKVRQLPVVDENQRVVGLHLWHDVLSSTERQNVMVIMAGGLGTRLRPHTEKCPKPLLPVAGKPMLQHIIERAKTEGFRRFVLATHYLGHMIESYFGDGKRWQVTIEYIREDSPLGTAGALGLLTPAPNVPFVVTNGDVLTDIRYAELLEFHCHHRAIATMAVRQHEWQHPFGVVRTNGVDIVSIEEKPITKTHINAGIYVFDPSVIQCLDLHQRCDMPTLFSRLRQRSMRTIVYPMHEPWRDIGRIDDYRAANEIIS